MKIVLKIILISCVIILVLVFLYIFGFLSFLNTPTNYILYGPIDISCNVDSDCVLKSTTCGVSCACYGVVNKNWNHKCFFGYKHSFALCEPCPAPGIDFEIKCVSNKCEGFK